MILDVILKTATNCDEYDIYLFDMGEIIAYIMECFDRGILSKNDTDGLHETWRGTNSILRLLKMIVMKKGFGKILAEGLQEALQIIGRGSEKYALNIKNMAPVMSEPRTSIGWGLCM